MLEKFAALKQKHEAKQAARREALEAIDAEFGDTEAALKEERQKILAFALENNFKTHFEKNGSFEVRTSAPKYKLTDISEHSNELFYWLVEQDRYDALEIKKSVLNSIAKTGVIPPSLVEVMTETEIAITVT